MSRKTLLCSLLLSLFFSARITVANAQTSTFTYQGRLSEGATVANGSYQMQFAIFDASGGQIGTTLTFDGNGSNPAAVSVADGIFSVRLDFGVNPYTSGADRFLEVRVKRAADSAYTTLAPRQQLTSAPFALRTISAGTADTLSNACVACVTDQQIDTVAGAKVTGSVANATNAVSAVNFTEDLSGDVIGKQAATVVVNVGGKSAAKVSDSVTDTLNATANNVANTLVRRDASASLTATTINATSQFSFGGSRFISIPGTNNTFVGLQSRNPNTPGTDNAFFGFNSGLNNTAFGNVFLGVSSGLKNTSGNFNTFVGLTSGHENTTADNNAFIGAHAGFSNTTGQNNTFVGTAAGSSNQTGANNTFLGTSSGFSNTTGQLNLFAGMNSGIANTRGLENVFLGAFAGNANTDGNYNVFVGPYAGFSSVANYVNTYVGYSAGRDLSNGSANVLIGNLSGVSLTLGAENVMVGTYAGYNGTTGQGNTFLGYLAGYSHDQNNFNTYLGYRADGGGFSTITNATAIGAHTIVTRSNSVVLGSGANVGIGTSAPDAKLHVNGSDIYVGSAGTGVILRSPNASCFRLTVSDGGVVSSVSVTCPN